MEAVVEKHVLSVMGGEGDLKTLWDPEEFLKVAVRHEALQRNQVVLPALREAA